MSDEYISNIDKKELLLTFICSYKVSWPLWIAISLGVILFVVGAVCNIKIMLLGLIICFAMCPSIAFFIYYTKLIDIQILLNNSSNENFAESDTDNMPKK